MKTRTSFGLSAAGKVGRFRVCEDFKLSAPLGVFRGFIPRTTLEDRILETVVSSRILFLQREGWAC